MANDSHHPNHTEGNFCKMKLRTDKKKVEMDEIESPGELDILVVPLRPWFVLDFP